MKTKHAYKDPWAWMAKYFSRIDWSMYHYNTPDQIEGAKQWARDKMQEQIKYMGETHGSDIENPFIFEVDHGPGEFDRTGFVAVWLNPVANQVRNFPKDSSGNLVWPMDFKIKVPNPPIN